MRDRILKVIEGQDVECINVLTQNVSYPRFNVRVKVPIERGEKPKYATKIVKLAEDFTDQQILDALKQAQDHRDTIAQANYGKSFAELERTTVGVPFIVTQYLDGSTPAVRETMTGYPNVHPYQYRKGSSVIRCFMARVTKFGKAKKHSASFGCAKSKYTEDEAFVIACKKADELKGNEPKSDEYYLGVKKEIEWELLPCH